MAAFVSSALQIQVICFLSLLWPTQNAPPVSFEEFQRDRINTTLPQLPLQVEVFGSIFQTAYYFVDVSIGAPDPQSLTMIIDTGSSTQGIPCHDCEACGHSHWDEYYNRTKSVFNERMPCGDCATCRLTTTEDALRSLAPTLLPFADSEEFNNHAAKFLLQDSSKMQCLYNVHYAEGSSLSGLFYTDVVWLNIIPDEVGAKSLLDAPKHSEISVCPNYPLSAGPSLPLEVPVGCHIEETHLFYDQKASGILGLEFWGNKGVPTFPTATLDALEQLYENRAMNVVDCKNPSYLNDDLDRIADSKFYYAFSLCLSPKGGVMSFGGPNSQFHEINHRTLLGEAQAEEFRIPLITTPGKAQSYLVGLKGIRIAKKNQFAEEVNSTKLYMSAFDKNRWDTLLLKPSAMIYEQKNASGVEVVPTLLDSGTTLTYLPARLFNAVLDGIGERVTANMHLRERVRAGRGTRRLQRRVSPETLFSTKTNKVIVIDSFQDVPAGIPDNVVEYIPMSDQPLLAGPKRLVRLSSLQSMSIKRSLRQMIMEAIVPRLPANQRNRRLQDSPPTWYAVLEPSAAPGEPKLVGFIDIPHSMEGAPPRALVSKLDGYNNGECWWLQEEADDLPLFPSMAFEFHNNVTAVWHPLSYLYSGTNDHFWCLAIMTDAMGTDNDKVDEEIIFGSNSFVHHDVVFALENSSRKIVPGDFLSSANAAGGNTLTAYGLHPNATVYMIPANCPTRELGDRA
eukprot:Gregarina_sp_Poly_1__9589@NODE_605_length_7202_cov_256_472039_g465_i0_p1_GENE_NODE_605_length_7202_cov_256_472039_g465_i0NODE_605_length_7202_cov_256_472039_g465_i0_p1_ORF_typecomplete_len734_score76_68TAXi_N/PF14543_6/5_7e22TAXi_N/PF14543_6/13Asp/PF00026_23/4_9e19TAXi_C/PF14541_6/6_8e02TAXi_C/PF14541_6/0_0056TAXi_C/PF14541_6/2_3e06gagasp_proteas/PF13975_6/14gagasp_proteas/PF13975_6/44zfCXXC/PF02008_20/96zfCXXC/PF02008_20/4_6_NODE_605_length_7202_cov_256_472039_g465_i015643765